MRTLWLAAVALTSVPLASALEGEVDVQIQQSQIVAGNPPSEISFAKTLAQATLSHRQMLVEGVNVEGTLWSSLDTLPSNNPYEPPASNLAFQSRVLEGWLSWEPMPGTLNLGLGKQVIRPSSGFSHTPLNFVSRQAEVVGARSTSSWEEGWLGTKAAWFLDNASFSVFWAPPLSWDTTAESNLRYLTSPQPQGFVQGNAGFSFENIDLRVLVFRGTDKLRGGFGLDSGWGDDLTFRVEAAGNASATNSSYDTLAGVTWTGSDQTILMAELSRDDTGISEVNSGFFRWAGKVGQLDADAWVRVDLADASGWLGSSVGWTTDRWALTAYWLAPWGSFTSAAGSSPWKGKLTTEFKAFF